ncbi:MAG: FAD-dependent oxidoreductase, partial [Syntrophomonas sp.]|nr:FAD-dependent oxidoreductase [Syntrophomonas sp.]
DYYIDLYRKWSEPPARDTSRAGKIVLAYVSAYGYTGMIANSIVEGLGMTADFEVNKYDLVETPIQEVLDHLTTADGLLIGSPTINGDALPPIWDLLVRLSPITNSDLVAGAFGAYGWSGEAVPNIEARLHSLRMSVLPGLRINFKPSEKDLEEAFTFGIDFGKAILDKKQPKSKKKWRCLVCGQVFEGEEPPEVCPACGVDSDNFVAESLGDEFTNNTNENFVIIGSGIAALSSAAAIRERNATAAITLLTEEKVKTYYRPALSDYLSADLPDDKLYVYGEDWYEDKKVDVKTSVRVGSIDTINKQVMLDNDTSQSYDKLIIATGARSNIPPFKGVDNQGVFALRTLEDAHRLKAALQHCKKAVVIGGGVLGLEAVEEMLALNIQVTVVEHNNRLMPRQLDEPSSQRLQELMNSRGINLCLGVDTEEILGDGIVSGVKLNTGEILDADLVLLSTGVKPNVELAKAAGLELDRGIVVDAGMRTSISDIYAAGDVAQFGDRLIGLWSISLEMGKVAGAVAAGDWLEYKEPQISTLLAAFGHEIFSIGEVNLPAAECRVVEIKDPAEDFYKKSFFKDGVLVGEIIIAPRVNTSDAFRTLGRDSSGRKKSNHWKCKVCGYIHEGSEPPEECPVCGAPQNMFEPV